MSGNECFDSSELNSMKSILYSEACEVNQNYRIAG